MNKNVFLLSMCQALLTTGNVLLVSVVALIGQSLTAHPNLATFPVASQFLGLMAATIPASLIMKRVGRKNGFYLGNCVGITGAAVCIYALSSHLFYLFSLGTFLLGIGIGFGTLYRFAAVEVCAEGQKSKAISFVMAGGVLAAIMGPQLAVYSQKYFGELEFGGAFVGLLILYSLALSMLAATDIPREPEQTVHADQRPLKEIARQPVFIVAVIVAMVSYVVMNLLMTATPLAMVRCGFTFPQAAHVIQWHVLGMFAPSFFTGSLLNRFGIYPIMHVGAAFMLACIAINLTGVSEWHFWTALVCLGIGWNFMFISATQLFTTVYKPAEKAKSQASNEFIVFGMVAVTALSAGWLEASLGWQAMNWIVLPVVLWAIGVIFYIGQQREVIDDGG
ncbi:MFS transporter [Neptuniibacter pectenicola]|jgi:MFS family permease|uniref:MFS transporter n=1 Tax=Neptuniibacter pectenicola TaxID=1806669 RepID=A0ABU9TQQ2_9GAMM|nr:MFS transporter [Neptuniibacter pectenicola]KXJ50124.1 MAG: MFS transporter [Neptuniibacter sp. Phe_28]